LRRPVKLLFAKEDGLSLEQHILNDDFFVTFEHRILGQILAAAWLFAYESWLESGRKDWPGQGINH